MAESIGLRQFRHENCLSYVIFDRGSRKAILVDPCVDLMQDYRAFLAETGLALPWVVDTHLHADHFSATHALSSECGSQIVMSGRTSSGRVTRRVCEGEAIEAGDVRLKVIESPGHTADSIVLVGHGFALMGDALWICAPSRVDYDGADPEHQWESLQKLRQVLGEETLLLPAHDPADFLFSTLQIEKLENPDFRYSDRAQFVEWKQKDRIRVPNDDVAAMLRFNCSSNPAGEAFRGPGNGFAPKAPIADTVPSISAQKFSKKIQKLEPGAWIIDIRDPADFARGHLPGSRNFPMAELGFRFPELKAAKKIYVYGLSDGRADSRGVAVVRTLAYLRLADVVHLDGGFRAWVQQGYPVEK